MNNTNIPYAGTTHNYPIKLVIPKLISKKSVKNDKKTNTLDKK